MRFTLTPIEAEYEQWLFTTLECERRQLREKQAPRALTEATNISACEETTSEGDPA